MRRSVIRTTTLWTAALFAILAASVVGLSYMIPKPLSRLARGDLVPAGPGCVRLIAVAEGCPPCRRIHDVAEADGMTFVLEEPPERELWATALVDPLLFSELRVQGIPVAVVILDGRVQWWGSANRQRAPDCVEW